MNDADAAQRLRALSPRELEVVRGVGSGASTREIAAALDVRIRTVESHLHHAFRKLDVHNRVQLVRLLATAGLLDQIE